MSRTGHVDQVAMAAAALVRTRRANCQGCSWWPPMTIVWRDAEGVRQWWMDDDLGPSEACPVCGRVPILDARVYRLSGSGWLEAHSEPNVSKEVLGAAARRWVDLFVATVNTDGVQHQRAEEINDQESLDYEVRYWARWRGAPQRVPPRVLEILRERDPWWREARTVVEPG